ncbi:hypothetical protein TNCV_4401711, partial [Trichonephila clavipes]
LPEHQEEAKISHTSRTNRVIIITIQQPIREQPPSSLPRKSELPEHQEAAKISHTPELIGVIIITTSSQSESSHLALPKQNQSSRTSEEPR